MDPRFVTLIGWASSAVLVVAIGSQVMRQWRAGDVSGVSPWLYVGQVAASTGFVVYSIALDNAVFVFTNATLWCAAVLGLALLVRRRRAGATAASGARRLGGGGVEQAADRAG